MSIRHYINSILDSPLLRSRGGCVAVTLLLCFGIALRLNTLNISTGRSPDESNYTAQAQRLLSQGSAALRGIADEYRSDPSARLAGPPTRAGYLWLLAGAMAASGQNDESAGASLSAAASIGSMLLITLSGVRFLPPWATIAALLLFIVFPAERELARRAWTDGVVGFAGLAVLYAACEITADSSRRFWLMVFVCFGSLGMVLKEFGAVIFALCAAWLLWLMVVRARQYRAGAWFVASGLLGTTLALSWLAAGVGGFGALGQIVQAWRGAHVANQYAIEFQSGPAWFLLRALYIMSPVGAVLALLALPICLFTRWDRNALDARNPMENPALVANFLLFFAISYVAIPALLPNWLNLRYVSVAYGPICLLAGLAFWYLVQRLSASLPAKARTPALLVASLLFVGAAIGDLGRFRRYFVNDGVGDLSVKLILNRSDMFIAEGQVRKAPSAGNYLDLCQRYEQNWRYQDSVAACLKSIELDGSRAAAHEQLAASYMDQALWEQAAVSAQRALDLDSGTPRARAILERAESELRLPGIPASSN